MKKSYMTPATTVVRIETMGMVALSQTLTIDNSYANSVTDENDLLSRRRSLWDDDEE